MFLRGNGGEIDAAEFIAPVINQFEGEMSVEEAAEALGLAAGRVVSEHHAPTCRVLWASGSCTSS